MIFLGHHTTIQVVAVVDIMKGMTLLLLSMGVMDLLMVVEVLVVDLLLSLDMLVRRDQNMEEVEVQRVVLVDPLHTILVLVEMERMEFSL